MEDNDIEILEVEDNVQNGEQAAAEDMEAESDFYEEDPNAIFETSYLITNVHQKDAVSVAISPSGKYIATGGCDDKCLLFKPSYSLKIPHMIYKASDTVQDLMFDPHEFFLAYISGESVNVIDMNNFIQPRVHSLDSEVSLIAWNADTQGIYDVNDYFLAVVPEHKYVARFRVDAKGLTELSGFYFGGETATNIKMVPKSSNCVMTFNNGLIFLIDVLKQTQIASISMRVPIHSLELFRDNSFVVGLSTGKVNLCSFGDGKIKAVLQLGDAKTEEAAVEAICLSKNPSRPFLALATLNGDIELHDTNTTNGLRFKYSVGQNSVLKLAFDEDANKLYAGTYDGTLYVFDAHSDRILDVYYSRGKVNTFAFAMCRMKNNKMIACSVSSRGQLRYFLDPFPEEAGQLSEILNAN